MVAGPNRKRVAIQAPADRWALLGDLLTARRVQLGYQYRPEFARDRGINVRRVADIENNYRPGTYPVGSLHEIAAAYQVTYESILAVLRDPAAALAPPAAAGLPDAPITDPARSGSDRPYAARIWQRLLDLAAAGNTDPSGVQVFPRSPADARTWDGLAGRMDTADRVWLIADLQRRDDGRDPDSSRAGNER